MIEGRPTAYISLKIFQSILKPKSLIFTACSFFLINIAETIRLHACPITVAIAAPATPSLGAPRSPKIKIGSRIKLTIAPVREQIIGIIILPVDCKTFSKRISTDMNMLKHITILI